MKNTMKTLLALTTACALSTSALAENIKLDHDGDGDFLEISKLNLDANPQEYILRQFLGGDGVFNNNDIFTETAAFSIPNYADWSSGLQNLTDADVAAVIPGQDVAMSLVAELSGVVKNVVVDVAAEAAALAALHLTPAYIAASAAEKALMDANVSFNNTSFSISFTAGTVGLYLDDTNADFGNFAAPGTGTQIGQWTSVDGSGDSPANTNGKPSTDFGFEMDFDNAWFNANPAMAALWQTEDGSSVFNGVAPALISGAISTINSSARPQSIVALGGGINPISLAGEGFFDINILDDGGSMEFSSIPEPSSIAILGLGLLGLAGARRRA